MYSYSENYNYYISTGRCPRCGGMRPLAPGKRTCRECALKQSEDRKIKTVFRRENGLCTRCGRPLSKGHKHVQCDECYSYNKAYHKERYDKMRDQGLCIMCKGFAEPGKTLCKACLERWHANEDREGNAEKQRQRRQECREKGLCIDCHTRKVEPGHTRCKRCRGLRMDSTRKYRIHNDGGGK
jgi:hypothetical protein